MNFEHLRALSAIVETGSFDAAAERLGVTPSAISQRIKALEHSAGQIVVLRGQPSTPTDAGTVLLRMARQMQLLETEALHALGHGPGQRGVASVAVNADSLATWFAPVLHAAAQWADTELDLHVMDQDHSTQLLRRAEVFGAVTADPKPVNGCRIELLGTMRYIPTASTALLCRHSTPEGVNWSELPALRYNRNDDMQHRLLISRGVTTAPPTHTIPSSEAFLEAVRAGLGWGMIPQLQLPNPGPSDLVPVDPSLHHDVALYWQRWSMDSPRLDRITDAIRAASAALRPV